MHTDREWLAANQQKWKDDDQMTRSNFLDDDNVQDDVFFIPSIIVVLFPFFLSGMSINSHKIFIFNHLSLHVQCKNL